VNEPIIGTVSASGNEGEGNGTFGLPSVALIFSGAISGRGLCGAAATVIPPGEAVPLEEVFTGLGGAVVLVLAGGAA